MIYKQRQTSCLMQRVFVPSYIKDGSASKKCACLDILSHPFLLREASDMNTAYSSSMAGDKVNASITTSSQTHSVQPIMFSNCTIKFNPYK